MIKNVFLHSFGGVGRDAIRPRYGPTQFKDLGLLRQAEVELTHGGAFARSAAVWGISEQSYCRCRRQALKSVDGLFLNDAAFVLRLHPKPADADKSIV
jgi:hypothetical protein